jgi:hypothetical protein
MYDDELEFLPSAAMPGPSMGVMFDAREVAVLSSLMKELRDVTQSRGTFSAASEILRRIGAEFESPRLVPADALDR